MPLSSPPLSVPKPARVTQEEKTELVGLVEGLDEGGMEGVLAIVKERMPVDSAAGGEIELDVDAMDDATLRELQRHVYTRSGRLMPPACIAYFAARSRPGAARTTSTPSATAGGAGTGWAATQATAAKAEHAMSALAYPPGPPALPAAASMPGFAPPPYAGAGGGYAPPPVAAAADDDDDDAPPPPPPR
jgi:hypothetical protein